MIDTQRTNDNVCKVCNLAVCTSILLRLVLYIIYHYGILRERCVYLVHVYTIYT